MLYRLLRPLIFALDAETAHRWTVRTLRAAGSTEAAPDDPILSQEIWGRRFANPVGLAAGFDKEAEVVASALGLGFGFVEAGGVTPRPQPGNPRPRLFRLAEDRAVINRMGFNSGGLAAFAERLGEFRRRHPAPAGLVGVNLGKNKNTPGERAAEDYAAGAACLAPLVDFLVVNVSSPNTPGLRALQDPVELVKIIRAVRAAMAEATRASVGAGPRPAPTELHRSVPLLLKLAPDLAAEDRAEVAALALAEGVDGLVIANTTIQRPASLASRHKSEAGGLSGAPLKVLALDALRDFRRLTEGQIPLIGVGGIASGEDAYRRIRAGACLIQLYTALVYEGPGLVARIKRDLAVRLRSDGFANVAAAVGAEDR